MSDTIAVTESVVEEVVLNLFEGLGYSVLNGPTIAPEQPAAERASFADVSTAPWPRPSPRATAASASCGTRRGRANR